MSRFTGPDNGPIKKEIESAILHSLHFSLDKPLNPRPPHQSKLWMEVSIPCVQTPLIFSYSKPPQTLTFYQLPTRRRLKIRASSSSANPSGSGSNAFSWLRLGSQKFWSKFGESVKKETGFDLDEANVKVGQLVGRVNQGLRKGEGEFNRLRTELLPEFVSWNRWDRWKVSFFVSFSYLDIAFS